MNIRFALAALVASSGLALAAQAADDAAQDCLVAAAKDDPQATVDACARALKADPMNERAKRALEAAEAEIARADEAEHPAKLKQN